MVLGYRLHSPYRKDGMYAWRISFVLEYDLEPVLKSRALGLRWLLLHILFCFQHTTQHHSAYPAWKTWNDAARLLHKYALW